eukprot:5106950-Lingulodinium_polyedra.AAC.1
MQSNSPFAAAAAACKSHASRVPCERQPWCAREVREACDSRAGAAADGRFDPVVVHGSKSVQNDAVEST